MRPAQKNIDTFADVKQIAAGRLSAQIQAGKHAAYIAFLCGADTVEVQAPLPGIQAHRHVGEWIVEFLVRGDAGSDFGRPGYRPVPIACRSTRTEALPGTGSLVLPSA